MGVGIGVRVGVGVRVGFGIGIEIGIRIGGGVRAGVGPNWVLALTGRGSPPSHHRAPLQPTAWFAAQLP